jgi:hypothetical protein
MGVKKYALAGEEGLEHSRLLSHCPTLPYFHNRGQTPLISLGNRFISSRCVHNLAKEAALAAQ